MHVGRAAVVHLVGGDDLMLGFLDRHEFAEFRRLGDLAFPRIQNLESSRSSTSRTAHVREVDEKREPRAEELIDRLAVALDDETDLEVVLTALVFAVAVACEAAAEESGSSAEHVADRFDAELRQFIEKVTEAMSRNKEDRAA